MALGEYLTGAVIALMLASGRSLEDFAEARARREMSALLSRVPRTANRYDAGNNLVQIPLDLIKPGDRLLVRAGEAVPTDGVVSGAAAVLDESALTGEPLPVERASGEAARSGAVNAAAPFDMIAATDAASSTFAGIVRLVDAAQKAKAPAARLADRYALLFCRWPSRSPAGHGSRRGTRYGHWPSWSSQRRVPLSSLFPWPSSPACPAAPSTVC